MVFFLVGHGLSPQGRSIKLVGSLKLYTDVNMDVSVAIKFDLGIEKEKQKVLKFYFL